MGIMDPLQSLPSLTAKVTKLAAGFIYIHIKEQSTLNVVVYIKIKTTLYKVCNLIDIFVLNTVMRKTPCICVHIKRDKLKMSGPFSRHCNENCTTYNLITVEYLWSFETIF